MAEAENSNGDFSRPIPQAAAAFAYAGALPFVVTAFLCWYPVDTFDAGSLARTSVETMLGFSVVILSFMGGVRWGIAAGAAGGPRFSHLLVSIVPPAVAWLAMVLASDWMYSYAGWFDQFAPNLLDNWRHAAQLIMMIAAFWILLMSDRRLKDELPAWYLGWRVPWTVLVELSLIAGLVRTIHLQVFAP
ncbi:MAG: DUF3429 domain-containing protein [Alphaproteobacteria bacterium]